MPDELSPSQAAARIGATTRSVQRWIALGRLPARRLGGRWRVASDVLDAFMASTTGAVDATVTQPQTSPARSGVPVGGDVERAPMAIRTLFIANRGEIARRVQRTADRLGVRTIIPTTDGPGALDLLDIEAVVAAARAASADAVHPGFGVLAENADFAQAVIDAGIRWLGPPPAAIRAMGDKAAARRLAARLGIPIVPGYDGAGQSDRVLRRAAAEIGYPLLVKPAAGGGGKGMRTVRTPDRLTDAVASARREASAAFGDDRLILERLVEGARHVEVQFLFDRHGHGIQLGERDCSVQRRHQKVLEETPSPGVGAELRVQLGGHALALARAVGYESAGTCEFLLSDRGEVFFLEMNTRLQVEHPVTELVSGRDLVEDQLRIAAGEALTTSQAEVDAALAAGGHAIEVRLYAEDPENGFLPSTGRVERLAWPAGTGIRIDAGIDAGTEVGGRFDPMLAKIVAHGRDRDEAIDRLTDALDGTTVLGLTTNLRFLRWLVRQPVVRSGEVRTDTLERIWPPDDWADRAAIPESAWQLAAAVLLRSEASSAAESWASGWRLNAPSRVRLTAADPPVERTVSLDPGGAGGPSGGGRQPPSPETAQIPAFVHTGDVVHIDVAGRSVAFRFAGPPDVDRAARAAAGHQAGAVVELVAPMPGAVLAVHRRAGDTVEAGDPIVTLEAMKMEHAVATSMGGRLADLRVKAGDQVTRGQLLAVVEPEQVRSSPG